MSIASFGDLQSIARVAPIYQALRQQHPLVPARDVHAYIHQGGGESLEQFVCRHEWVYTGTSYGGDDDRWNGEGRCYCAHCGADGDA